MRANLYVGNVPFDLLLGRPWQRGNKVSIDELEDGTYLIFKDPNMMEPKHKVLVTPDAIVTEGWDFDPSTWLAMDKVLSYFTKVVDTSLVTCTPKKFWTIPVEWRMTRNFPYLERRNPPVIEVD